MPPRADSVAHQAVGRGGQCIYRNQHNDVDASHDVGNSEFALSQPLHCHKENKPGGHRQEILKHGEARYTENAHQQNRVERPQAVEAILFQVDGDVRINQEKSREAASAITEAMAAPLMPISGSPKCPNIRA